MSTEAQAAKKALRKEIKTRLSSVREDGTSSQSEKAQNLILNLPQYKNANRISVYLSMPKGEARTDNILRDALSSGKQVFVPYMYKPSQVEPTSGKKRKVMDMLRLDSLAEFEGLERDSWGIPTLPEASIEGRENAMGSVGLELAGGRGSKAEDGGLDLIVVPGVAFDEEMRRLGHGAGFYDSFLTRLCADGKRQRPFLVGLCLAEQILAAEQEVPTTDWDWKMDAVASGDGRLLKSKSFE